MTQQELFEQIRQLPLRQKVEILETVVHDLGEELKGNGGSGLPATRPETTTEEKRAALERLRGLLKIEVLPTEGDPQRLSQRLYGILQFDGEPPTNDEIKNTRADYLLEKYS